MPYFPWWMPYFLPSTDAEDKHYVRLTGKCALLVLDICRRFERNIAAFIIYDPISLHEPLDLKVVRLQKSPNRLK